MLAWRNSKPTCQLGEKTPGTISPLPLTRGAHYFRLWCWRSGIWPFGLVTFSSTLFLTATWKWCAIPPTTRIGPGSLATGMIFTPLLSSGSRHPPHGLHVTLFSCLSAHMRHVLLSLHSLNRSIQVLPVTPNTSYSLTSPLSFLPKPSHYPLAVLPLFLQSVRSWGYILPRTLW